MSGTELYSSASVACCSPDWLHRLCTSLHSTCSEHAADMPTLGRQTQSSVCQILLMLNCKQLQTAHNMLVRVHVGKLQHDAWRAS